MAVVKSKTKKTGKKKTVGSKASKSKTKVDQELKLVKILADQLLEQLKVDAKITLEKDKEGSALLHLQTEDPGALIGYHGETLASFQLILSMMVYRQLGQWLRILVDVNDYREKRRESLEKMALSAAQKAKFSGESQPLPPLSASERRLVHLALAKDEEVETESEGEGFQRRVLVKPVQ